MNRKIVLVLVVCLCLLSSSGAAAMMMGGEKKSVVATKAATVVKTPDKKTPVVPDPDPEVFWVGGPKNNYYYTKSQAAGVCNGHDAVVATNAQLTSAHAAEADWCATGWLSDQKGAKYPITTTLIGGCGNGKGSDPAIMSYVPPDGKAGVNCYGIKPAKDATRKSSSIRGFNKTKWSRYD